ncbi:MAG: hypothetical protein ACLUIW_00175 [Dysosmobacter welbionis]
MQRQACQEFAAARGWKIIKEFYEKGISGSQDPHSGPQSPAANQEGCQTT